MKDRYEGRSNEADETSLHYGIIEVTTKCQLRCPGCYMVRRDALNKGEMTLDGAIHILDLCHDYRGCELEAMDILGGEPLLWPYLKPYIEELLDRNILPWIFTNMLAITPKLARWLYEREVHITGKLNIAKPSDPEQIKFQGEMIGRDVKIAHEMINAIEIFRNVGYHNPLFRLQNLVRKNNLHLIPGYIHYCRSRNIGVDLELMGSGEMIGPEYFSIAPTAQELANIVRELDRLGKSGFSDYPEFQNPIDKLLMPHVFGACPFYDKGLYFAVDGYIRSCSNSTTVLSHINDSDPIRQAWESSLLHHRRMLTQKNVGEPCGTCNRWDKCRGGCRATIEGMGDPFGGYPLCPVPLL